MAAIFEGVDDLIDQALGVTRIGTTAPHYRHKSSALALNGKPPYFSASAILRAALDRIYENWHTAQRISPRRASAENWRWKKQLHISDKNKSPEKQVEKRIAAICDENWVNQVPTASGLVNSSSEQHCNIDLVHRISANQIEFIELKYDSDTPLFAAFEILKYALLYVFSRAFAKELGYPFQGNPILDACFVRLCVLAPPEYYRSYMLDWLQPELNAGLSSLGLNGYKMDFRFESMPWPYDGDVGRALASRCPLFKALEALTAFEE